LHIQRLLHCISAIEASSESILSIRKFQTPSFPGPNAAVGLWDAKSMMRIGSLRQAVRSFLSDRSGNVLTLFAITLVPILALTGGLIDYTEAANVRIQLNAAADSAALAAVSQAAMLKSVADSKADAEKIFDANAVSYKSMLASRTVEITNVGLSRSAKVVYSANSPTYFASFVGQDKVVVSGTSSAAGARALHRFLLAAR
jgi:Flp pilus assembly protein TadG